MMTSAASPRSDRVYAAAGGSAVAAGAGPNPAGCNSGRTRALGATNSAVVQHHLVGPAAKRRKMTKVDVDSRNSSSSVPAFLDNGQIGFPVNGFHPQWTGSPLLLASTKKQTSQSPPISDASANSVVGTKIAELIKRLRFSEEAKKERRMAELARARETERTELARALEYNETEEEDSGFNDLYEDIFLSSTSAQLLVSPGGRILAWNEKFVNITDLAEDEISELLTVFNLVQSDYIPRLFNLFSLALRGGSPPPLRLHSSDESSSDCGSACETSPPAHGAANAQCGQDDACSSTDDAIKHDVGECSSENESANRESSDDYQHVSMVVPCATFKNNQESYCVTITLMNDIDPRRRCFHCVFGDSAQPMQAENDVPVRDKCPTEKSSAEFGIIRRISYASLARQL